MSHIEEDNSTGIQTYCTYCKLKIEVGEPYVVSGLNIYHARENEKHDNCYSLVIEGEN